MIELVLPDPAATDALGARLAQLTVDVPALTVHLHGELGAGKTALVRAWLRALGVTGTIRSPTYTLVEPHATTRGTALHLDLYRVQDAAELDGLDLDGGAREHPPWFFEWPERGGARVPAADLILRLRHNGGDPQAGRVIRIETVERLRGIEVELGDSVPVSRSL